MSNERPPSDEQEEKSVAVNDKSSPGDDSFSNPWEQELAQIRDDQMGKLSGRSAGRAEEKGSLEFGSSDELYGRREEGVASESPAKLEAGKMPALPGSNRAPQSESAEASHIGESADKLVRQSGSRTVASSEAIKTSLPEYANWLATNFDKFDNDKDGKLDRAEVETQVLDPANKGKDAVYAATLNTTMLTIEDGLAKFVAKNEGKNADGLFLQNNALSRASVEAFNAMVSDPKELKDARADAAASTAWDKFAHLDTNKTNRVSRKELNAALADKNWSKDDRESLKQILYKYDSIAKAVNELHDYPEGDAMNAGEEPQKTPALQKMVDETISERDLKAIGKEESIAIVAAQESLAHHTERFNRHLAAVKSGKSAEISQGSVNDCFLIAPMKELAKRDPEALSKMISDNKDGTFSVKFPDSPKSYTVKAPTEAELASYTNNKDSSIIEKAFGIRYKEDHPEKKSSLISTEQIDRGSPQEAITALTGSNAETAYVVPGGEDALKMAKEAAEKGEMLIAASKESPAADGVQSSHAFGMSYNKDSGKIVLQNPYSVDARHKDQEPVNKYGKPLDGKLDGKFEMDAHTFSKSFSHIFRERKDKK
ncbi:MAG: hypothetical protein K2X77_11775 [Candidatus Obscuribacterales bacterium]|nr:hypothetical protein [Candidatus Obscuribacterales bacterium]